MHKWAFPVVDWGFRIGDLGLGIGDWIFGNMLAHAKIGWNRLEYAGIC